MDQNRKRYRLVHAHGDVPAYLTGTRDEAGRWALAESERAGWQDWQLEVDHDGSWEPVPFPVVEDPGPVPPEGSESI